MTAEIESRLGIIASSIADGSVDLNPWEGQPGNGSPLSQENGGDSRADPMTDGTESTSRSEVAPATPRFSVSVSEDSILEQQFMTKQLRTLAQEVKRIRAQAVVNRARGVSAIEEAWTPRELVLVRKAVEKWKDLRNFAMAEQLLHMAGDVREANIIACGYFSW